MALPDVQQAAAGEAPTQAQVPAQAPAQTPATEPSAVGEELKTDDEIVDGIEGFSIETSRCTTCNECTQINNRLFKYNDDMQAYIADPDAGTFREIVEAAESCQVSIIHPGQPRNPDEPNLEDLIARAEPFN